MSRLRQTGRTRRKADEGRTAEDVRDTVDYGDKDKDKDKNLLLD